MYSMEKSITALILAVSTLFLRFLCDRVAVMSKAMVELKCALVDIGQQSAMSFGRIRMQVLHVSSWDSLSMVSKHSISMNFTCKLHAIIIGAVAGRGIYTESTLPMYLVDLNCTGNEQRLQDCPRNALVVAYSSCANTDDASLRCQGLLHSYFCGMDKLLEHIANIICLVQKSMLTQW